MLFISSSDGVFCFVVFSLSSLHASHTFVQNFVSCLVFCGILSFLARCISSSVVGGAKRVWLELVCAGALTEAGGGDCEHSYSLLAAIRTESSSSSSYGSVSPNHSCMSFPKISMFAAIVFLRTVCGCHSSKQVRRLVHGNYAH